MFAPPVEIASQAFAGLPPALDLSGRDPPSPWVADRPQYRGYGSFLEGPAFDRDGRLLCVDIAHGRILRISRNGRFEVVLAYEGAPNGLAIHRDGRLFIADHRLGLVVAETRTGEWAVLLDRAFGEPFKGLNDLHFSRSGDLYFTDQGQTGLHDPSGRLLCLRADGRLNVVMDGIPSPNGLALNGGESALWLAVTRANQVWKLPLTPQGRVTKAGVFVTLQGGGPDGLAVAADDSLWVAQPGVASVWGFSAHGEPIARIRCPGPGRMVTNLAFDPMDGGQLCFVESSHGVVYRSRLEVEGAPLFSHQ
jgi:gluconolactonase